MKKILAFTLSALLLLVFLAGCTNPSEDQTETMPIPSISVPQGVETAEDLTATTEAPRSDSTSEDLVATTEPVPSESAGQSNPTETQPEASTEAPMPTEPGVIDEYIATGAGTPAG